MGRIQHAVELFDEALIQLVHDAKNPRQKIIILNNLGVAHQNLGNINKALQYFDEVVSLSQQSGYRQFEASAIGNLGLCEYRLGHMEAAIKYNSMQLELERKTGDRRGEANALGVFRIGVCRYE